MIEQVRLIGFAEKPTKGKPTGLVAGDDCSYSFMLFGKSASMGGMDIRKAMNAARYGQRTNLKKTFNDEWSGGARRGAGSIRYINNVTMEHDFSNYFVFSKSCVVIEGKGFL